MFSGCSSVNLTAISCSGVSLQSLERVQGYSHSEVRTILSISNILVLIGGISMKRATNIHHVSVTCSKRFHSDGSKVKVITNPKALFQQRYSHRLAAVCLLCIQWRHTGVEQQSKQDRRSGGVLSHVTTYNFYA